ncbi:MAG: hypothetical protein QM479_09280 [Pseudomonadota bacterium]
MATNKQQTDTLEQNKTEKNQSASPNNLITFASTAEPNALELNRRLKTFEEEISALDNKLLRSHNEFRSSITVISKQTTDNSSKLNLTQKHLRNLDSTYKSLTTQADILAKKTSSLGSLFEKSYKKQSDSFQFIDNKITVNKQQLSKELNQIKQDLRVLEKNYSRTSTQTQQLLNNVNSLHQNVQNTNQEQSQKIQSIERRLTLKTTYLDNQLKQLINEQDKDLEHLQSAIIDNEKQAEKELLAVNEWVAAIVKEQSEQFKQIDKKLEDKQTKLKQAIKNQDIKLTEDIHVVSEKIASNEFQQQKTQGLVAGLGSSFIKLTDKISNFHKQLSQKIEANHNQSITKFDDLNKLQQQSKHKQSEHEQQINALQKTNNHLAYRVEQVGENVEQLNRLTSDLDIEQKSIHQQVVSNAQLENTHFNSLSSVLAVVIIVILSSFYYIWNTIDTKNSLLLEQQQSQFKSLQQQNLDLEQLQQTVIKQQQLAVEQDFIIQKNVINEQNAKHQVTQLSSDLDKQTQVTSSYQQQLQQQLQQHQLQIRQQQQQQQVMQNNMQRVDDQMLYLNQTVGPFSELQSGNLEGPIWLKDQNAQNYTIKLKIFSSKQALFAFIADEAYYLNQELAFYPTIMNGKTTYSLLYGSFENKAQAQFAIDELPYKLSGESEGIISMESIQSSL